MTVTIHHNPKCGTSRTVLKTAPGVDMELQDEYQGFPRSLARR